MSTGPGVIRHGASAAARTERKGWLESIKDESISFLKGDNNAPWAILAETIIGFVPILGQVVDARDVIKGLVEVAGAPGSPLAWFNLITALIGLVPGGGDAVKRSLRAVKSGTVRVDDLLGMIRRLYKGDPEVVLRNALDLSKLRGYLDGILGNPKLTRQLGPQAQRTVQSIRTRLGQQFDAFKAEVDGWLAKGRRTSAEGSPLGGRARTGTPAQKPGTQVHEGSTAKMPHGDAAAPNTPNASRQRTERFKSLTQKVLGVMGEHMADYHCQDVKGWGAPRVVHDTPTAINPAKLNDGGHLVQLWPTIPRGRGIDAVWKTPGGTKPYAIIEAKASYDPTKSLRQLLGEAGDKTERSQSSSAPRTGRAGRSGPRGSGTSSAGTVRQANGMVTQMSHSWIDARLRRAVGPLSPDLVEIRKEHNGMKNYSRHVVFFSIPAAVGHAEALIGLASGRSIDQSIHSAHAVSREWMDSAISAVVNDRAGLSTPAQRRPH